MTTTGLQQSEILIVFRAIGLTSAQVDEFRECLGIIPVESHRRKGKDDYVMCIELNDSPICDAVRHAISKCPLTAPFGVYVSLVSENDSDGLTIPPFVCSFWRDVGGSLDFSFTVI